MEQENVMETEIQEAKKVLEMYKNGEYDDDSDEVFEVLDCYCGRVESEMLQELCREREISNALLEPSTQAGKGKMFLFADGYDGKGWDFQLWLSTERELLSSSSTEEEFKEKVKKWIGEKLDELTK